ncbi:MAG: glycosyltransferase [Candidatus Solibacter usitatus]|nr:glycosyltransferase [Candidatus Solibacter usitatus]
MKVLHLDSGREMRGGQWQALHLLNELRIMGVEQKLLARAGSPLGAEAGRLGFLCGQLSAFAVWRESRRYDVTHAHDAHSHTLAALAAGNRIVVSRRVAFPVGRGTLSRWKYSQGHRYLAVSNYVAGELRAAGIPPQRIAVVSDGVPVLTPVAHLGDVIVSPQWNDGRKPMARKTYEQYKEALR